MVNDQIPMLEDLEAMTPAQYKAVENRLRVAAARQGLRLEKSRSRDPRAVAFGTYALIAGPPPSPGGGNWRSRTLVAGDHNTGFGLTLEEVARHLFEYPPLVWRGPRPELGVEYHEYAISEDNENEFLIGLGNNSVKLKVRRLGEWREDLFESFQVAEGESPRSVVRVAQTKAEEVNRKLWELQPVQI